MTKEYLDKLAEKNGKSSFIWILGQYGQHIAESPYVLEKIIEEEQDQQNLTSIELQKYLVVSCMKLFFHRAPEMQPIMAKFFQQIMKNSNDADLRQRVTLYYKLLRQDINLARQVVSYEFEDSKRQSQFLEDIQSLKRERLFMEFNTLSVVYGRPSETFLKDAALKQSIAAEKKFYPPERGFSTSDQDKLLSNEQQQAAQQEAPA